jgi:hypothetical protein
MPSVADPNPKESEIFCRIRIRIQIKFRIQIRIQIGIQTLKFNSRA